MKILKAFLVLIIASEIFINCEKSNSYVNANYDFLLEKPFGLIIENTEVQNDVRIYYGRIIRDDNNYFFVNVDKSVSVSFDDEHLKRIKKVTIDMKENVKSLQNCEYSLWMKMEDIDKSTKEMRSTGIIWKNNTKNNLKK
jgi:hypothetical protein